MATFVIYEAYLIRCYNWIEKP